MTRSNHLIVLSSDTLIFSISLLNGQSLQDSADSSEGAGLRWLAMDTSLADSADSLPDQENADPTRVTRSLTVSGQREGTIREKEGVTLVYEKSDSAI